MTFKEFMEKNNGEIECITIHNEIFNFFSNKVEAIDFIYCDNTEYKLILNDLTLKLQEWQVQREESFRMDKICYFDLVDVKIDCKLK